MLLLCRMSVYMLAMWSTLCWSTTWKPQGSWQELRAKRFSCFTPFHPHQDIECAIGMRQCSGARNMYPGFKERLEHKKKKFYLRPDENTSCVVMDKKTWHQALVMSAKSIEGWRWTVCLQGRKVLLTEVVIQRSCSRTAVCTCRVHVGEFPILQNS